MNPTLKLLNIEKEYEDKPLLKGVSFEVKTGEVFCLLGSSGSGKSTLLRIIAGIETADSGTVLWQDQDLSATPTHLRHFGLMFQDYALFPHMNVSENVAFGLRMQGYKQSQYSPRVKEALDQVNLAGFEKRSVTDLSGGEQQRVALARALAPSPRLLMLDEPLAALDRSLRQQLQEELRSLLHQTRIPAIYVTHDQEEALALGDRLALLNEGQIVQMGAPDEVYRKPLNRWVANFLGMENIFSGEVSEIKPLQVHTALGSIQAIGQPNRHLRIGEKVNIVILSTGASIEGATSQENKVTGKVEECVFSGEHYKIKIRTSGGSLLNFFFATPFKVGEEVTIKFSSNEAICLID